MAAEISTTYVVPAVAVEDFRRGSGMEGVDIAVEAGVESGEGKTAVADSLVGGL